MAFTLETADLGVFEYNIGKPGDFASAPALSYPALIHYHGTGGVGQGLVWQLTGEPPTPITEINNGNFNKDSDGNDWNFIVFGCYLPSGLGDWDNAKMRDSVKEVKAAAATYKLDISQIYITGLSLGSIGCHLLMGVDKDDATFYEKVNGIFPVSGSNVLFSQGTPLTLAERAAKNKNAGDIRVIRGWYGLNDSFDWVIGAVDDMPSTQTLINAEIAGYYELTELNSRFAFDNKVGTFQMHESLSWAAGAGEIVRIEATVITVSLTSGVSPSDNNVITGADSGATADVNGSATVPDHSGTSWGVPYQDHSSVAGKTIYYDIEVNGDPNALISSVSGTTTLVGVMKQDQKMIGVFAGISTVAGILISPELSSIGSSSKETMLI